MKRRKVIIHEAAISDLEDIWLYTLETWSTEQADRYHNLLYKEIEFLSSKPTSGKSMGHLRPDYYSSKVKSHFIFYKFSASELEIIRILHESMDIPNKF
jgi:toxin ParE1/3/4